MPKRSCNLCGEDDQRVLERHHKIPRRLGGADSEENLITLCSNCHYKIEAIYDKAFWMRAQERVLATADGNDSKVYCPACRSVFDPDEGHDCTARGEHFRTVGDRDLDGPAEDEQQDGVEKELPAGQQIRIAQEYRNMGKTLMWIEKNVDEITYSREWVRQNTSNPAKGEVA